MTFSATVNVTGAFQSENSFLFYSPGGDEWVHAAIFQGVGSATTITFRNGNLDSDCTLAVMLQQPSHLTASDPFQLATPTVPIT